MIYHFKLLCILFTDKQLEQLSQGFESMVEWTTVSCCRGLNKWSVFSILVEMSLLFSAQFCLQCMNPSRETMVIHCWTFLVSDMNRCDNTHTLFLWSIYVFWWSICLRLYKRRTRICKKADFFFFSYLFFNILPEIFFSFYILTHLLLTR